MPDTPPKFYLTTPIYYVNARPHIGHAYTTLVADTIARRHRLMGDDTFFLTGTDEHGQKIERSAAAAGIPPQAFADEVSDAFKSLWDRMGLTYNDYIRTTDPRHKQGAQKLFADLHARGQIYLSSYTGQYSIGEEMFIDGPPGTIGPDGRPTETVTEENFFFKLSDYQLPLLDLIESDTLHIQPESRKNEVLSFLRGDVTSALRNGLDESGDIPPGYLTLTSHALENGRVKQSASGLLYVPGALRDLSVSRSSFTWGIPVPEPAASETQQKHVIYVWLDALANYMTAVGYGSEDPEDQAKFEKYWPADLHLVGKEIIRFHCVYWPAFLLALNPAMAQKKDEPTPVLSFEEHRTWAAKWLPKAVTAHGWLLFDDSKMSKSKGNIVRTETILDAFGTLLPKSLDGPGPEFSDEHWKHQQDLFATDILRYFLLREIPFGQDGSFSFEAMITRYNADLANGYGNLVSRTLSMIQKYFDGAVPSPSIRNEFFQEVVYDAESDNSDPGFGTYLRSFLHDKDPSSEQNRQIGYIQPSFGEASVTRDVQRLSRMISELDKYISLRTPWKDDRIDASDRPITRANTLFNAIDTLCIITSQLYPILPYATAKVWLQLGLGDIEQAAAKGELKDLEWGGLKPGTKLGPLGPIFPRADKGLAQIMTDIEASKAPKSTLTTESNPTKPEHHDSNDPAAGPRTSTFAEPNPGATVGGSHAVTTERVQTSHADAPASGPFVADALATATPDTPQIAIDDFVKIDLRVAKIIVAERIPKADKLLRLEVDLGYEQRQILSGIAEWYTPEELIGRRIVIIANLAPRKMRGLESHGMLLAASSGDNTKPVLTTFPDTEDLALGSRVR